MFTQLGDTLALQYGGSETNKRVATEADQVPHRPLIAPTPIDSLGLRASGSWVGGGYGTLSFSPSEF